jgi:hypothetical protein
MRAEVIAVEAHQRGDGCEWCKYGLVDAPLPSPKVPLSEARRVQWGMGLLVTCNCEMGVQYERWLSNGDGIDTRTAGTKGRNGVGAVPVRAGESWVSRSAQGIAAS